MKDIPKLIGEDEHEKRMAAARERAEWELGSSSWAGVIVGAYLWPEEDGSALDRERGPDPAAELDRQLSNEKELRHGRR